MGRLTVTGWLPCVSVPCDTGWVATDDSGTWNDHAKMKTCNTCRGEGQVTSMVANAKGETKPVTGPCKPCNGTGTP